MPGVFALRASQDAYAFLLVVAFLAGFMSLLLQIFLLNLIVAMI
jgi:hypothetical protein